ncbi:ABC transporter permease [Burkholderia cepacia]|uniref:ABC transporter permease n=1 Tax=Burkholderia cepacia TaxID=292 RepID=UPI0007C853F5|nr:ABC transporter permease [Burkholderia cepacia]
MSRTARIVSSSPAPSRPGALAHKLLEVPPSYVVLALVLAMAALVNSNLLRPHILLTFLKQSAPLGLAVLGQLLVVRVRSIDLSVGGVFLVCNYLLTCGALDGFSPAAQITVPLVFGVAVGAVNGALVAYVRASAVISTLGVSTVLGGLVLFASSGRPPGQVPNDLRVISAAMVGPVSLPVLLWCIAAAILALVLRYLVFGRFVTVVGSNPLAARFSGVSLPRIVAATHVMAGLLAALGGMLFTTALGVGSVNLGSDIMMNSVAATILGGVTFGSGRGSVAGPMAAVAAFALLFPMLTVMGVEEPGKLIVQGLAIAIAAIVYGVKNR